MANVITPSLNDEGQFIGAEIEQRGEGLWRGDQTTNFIHDEVSGQTRHIFENVVLEEDGLSGFNEKEYVDSVVESIGGYGHYNAMAAWAQNTFSDEILDWYNSSIESDDLTQLNRALDWLKNEYASANKEEESTETEEDTDTTPDDIEAWYDNEVSEEQFNEEYNALAEAEYSEAHLAQMVSLANRLPSESVEASVLAAGAAIANGSTTFEDAFESLCKAFGEAHVVYAYRQLQQYLN